MWSEVPEQSNPPAPLFARRLFSRSPPGLFRDTLKFTGDLKLYAAMNPLETLSLVLGAGFASGLNVYATVATLGLLQRFGVIHLPEHLQVLAHPFVLAIAGVLYVTEFLADKVPFIDSIWQAIHTFIRPPAAALLAFSATAAVNISPEPLSNWALSFGEDVLAVWLTWFATAHPAVAIIVVAVLFAISLYLLYHLFHFLRRTLRKLAET